MFRNRSEKLEDLTAKEPATCGTDTTRRIGNDTETFNVLISMHLQEQGPMLLACLAFSASLMISKQYQRHRNGFLCCSVTCLQLGTFRHEEEEQSCSGLVQQI